MRCMLLADRLFRLGFQIILLKSSTVGNLMSGGLIIGTIVFSRFLGGFRFSLREYFNVLTWLSKERYPMWEVKPTSISSDHSTTLYTIHCREFLWLLWETWPFSYSQRFCKSQWYLCQSWERRIMWGHESGYWHWAATPKGISASTLNTGAGVTCSTTGGVYMFEGARGSGCGKASLKLCLKSKHLDIEIPLCCTAAPSVKKPPYALVHLCNKPASLVGVRNGKRLSYYHRLST